MKRRPFLGMLATLGAAAAQPAVRAEIERNIALEDPQLLGDLNQVAPSHPILQCRDGRYAVVWSVERPSTGSVRWGTTPDLGMEIHPTCGGLYPYEERFLSAEFPVLVPGTTYYYQTETRGVEFQRYQHLYIGEPVLSDVYSFTVPDPNAPTHRFAVISDTHESTVAMSRIAAKLAELRPEALIWNGDLLNDTNSADQAVAGITRAIPEPWLSSQPVHLTGGNHDHRGPWARNMTKIFLPQNRFSAEYESLVYNTAFRLGPVAILCMDTGEDKPDFHPVWEGLAAFDAHRVLQAKWLEETLQKPEIASAPFVILCCHIPLFDPNPDANPGEILEAWADWQSRCAELWSPILNKYHAQAVIVGHQHRLLPLDAPDENRRWYQVHGGGPSEERCAVIEGSIENDQLILRRHCLLAGTVDEEIVLKPREI